MEMLQGFHSAHVSEQLCSAEDKRALLTVLQHSKILKWENPQSIFEVIVFFPGCVSLKLSMASFLGKHGVSGLHDIASPSISLDSLPAHFPSAEVCMNFQKLSNPAMPVSNIVNQTWSRKSQLYSEPSLCFTFLFRRT